MASPVIAALYRWLHEQDGDDAGDRRMKVFRFYYNSPPTVLIGRYTDVVDDFAQRGLLAHQNDRTLHLRSWRTSLGTLVAQYAQERGGLPIRELPVVDTSSKPYQVTVWLSDPRGNNDDCMTGDSFDSVKEAEIAYKNPEAWFSANTMRRVTHVMLDGGEDLPRVRRCAANPKPEPDDDDIGRSEAAMQAAMAFGVDAWNEVKGWNLDSSDDDALGYADGAHELARHLARDGDLDDLDLDHLDDIDLGLDLDAPEESVR